MEVSVRPPRLRGVGRSVPVSLIPPFFMKLIANLQKWRSVIKTADSNSACHHWSSGSDGTGRSLYTPDAVFNRKLFKIRKWNVQFCRGRSQNPKYWKLFSSSSDFQDILVPPVNETGRI